MFTHNALRIHTMHYVYKQFITYTQNVLCIYTMYMATQHHVHIDQTVTNLLLPNNKSLHSRLRMYRLAI